MQKSTVAKRTLLDATRCPDGNEACYCITYIWPGGYQIERPVLPPGACRCSRCAMPDTVAFTYLPYSEPGGACFSVSMGGISVDGHRTFNRRNYGTYIFNLKDDDPDYCRPDEDGFCRCVPRDYHPEPYASGDICETCWLMFGAVAGVGASPRCQQDHK